MAGELRQQPRARSRALPTALAAAPPGCTAVHAGGCSGCDRLDRAAPSRYEPQRRPAVVLPQTLSGLTLAPARSQLPNNPNWAAQARSAYGTYPSGSASYEQLTDGRQSGQLTLVVVRGDFPDSMDLRAARPPFTGHGAVQCTHTIDASPDGTGTIHSSPATTLCSRRTANLTVSVMGLGSSLAEDRVAAAVDEAWTAEA